MNYLSEADIAFINEVITGYGHVINVHGLAAAAYAPRTTVFGADAYTTMAEKAAVLTRAIAVNHPFMDGNKRTALAAMTSFLKINNVECELDAEELAKALLNLVVHGISMATFIAYLRTGIKESIQHNGLQQAINAAKESY